MTEQKRVSDDRLADLLDRHAQAWIDNWNDGELAMWDADKELQSYKDLATLLRELQRRRAQRCEACASWRMGKRGWCSYLCDSEDHEAVLADASDGCHLWESKEQMPLDTDGESG